MADSFLKFLEEVLQVPLDLLLKEHFDKEVFKVTARLDVPTNDDKIVAGRLEAASARNGRHSVVWESLSVILGLLSSITRLVTELGLLVRVVGDQQDGIYLAVVHLVQETLRLLLAPQWSFSRAHGSSPSFLLSSLVLHFLAPSSAWVAVTDNEHYIKLNGLEQLVQGSQHRQEIVAGNLAEVLLTGE